MIRLKLTENQLKEDLLVWQMKERINRYKIELLLSEGVPYEHGVSATLGKLLEEISDIQVEIALVEAFLKDKGVKMYSGKEALLIIEDMEKEPIDIGFSPKYSLKQKLKRESLEVIDKIRELDQDTRESKDREHTHLLRLSSDIMEEYLDTLRERLDLS